VVYSAGTMGNTVDEKREQVSSPPFVTDEAISEFGELVNTSGHVQELDRNFGFWSICAISIVADDAWAAGGGSLVRSPLHAP
jgi:choline transport protein